MECQKGGFHCIRLPIILINSVFTIGKNYYPQVLLKKCKYSVKEKKVNQNINDYLLIY